MAGQEFLFRNRVLAQQHPGLGAYVPARRSLVRTKRHASALREVTHPAFARYVFLHRTSSPEDDRALSQSGVDYRLMRIDSQPAVLLGSEVQFIRESELSGRLDNMPKDASLDFRAGGFIIITQGPFEGTVTSVAESPRPWATDLIVKIGGFTAKLPLSHCVPVLA